MTLQEQLDAIDYMVKVATSAGELPSGPRIRNLTAALRVAVDALDYNRLDETEGCQGYGCKGPGKCRDPICVSIKALAEISRIMEGK